ncbi:MAG: sigma-70 family RNA polymerase sigma factor [Kiritimatiellae bacterium]|nr:sigma-70 family RNA polymerase sigma factor [Kiritimatiellia bacterium]
MSDPSPTSSNAPAAQSTAADPPDEVLVRRARDGDTAAFDQLVHRYFDRVFGLVYHMIGHRQDAEDLVQTIFLRAYRALRRFRGDAAFSTWLYRIALNTSYTAAARRHRRPDDVSLADLGEDVGREASELLASGGQSPPRQVGLKELQQRLNEALQTLSEEHRQVVVLHDIQGWRHEDIARVLQLPVGTVRSRLFYARRRLQELLAEFAP